ncbi:hypothetical protein [Actinophytocola oryzae]|uniref:hypothetical protein n=1 Tax=Actinophytocola oryzae TaxID=502181 RepID=UPI001062DB1B|nr:hypothetical protein [Actinophytocola oryzae]
MQRTVRLPVDTKLVLPVRAGHVVREHAPTVGVFLITTVLAGIGVGITGSVVWVVVGLLCLAGVVLEVLLVRAQAGFGPLLAADSDHVWVRAGGFLSPQAVRLDWAEVTVVTLHLWHGRRKATARYLSFDLTDEAAAELVADSRLASRARRLTRVFGSPLAVAEQGAPVLDRVLRELRDLAPDGVRFTERS